MFNYQLGKLMFKDVNTILKKTKRVKMTQLRDKDKHRINYDTQSHFEL